MTVEPKRLVVLAANERKFVDWCRYEAAVDPRRALRVFDRFDASKLRGYRWDEIKLVQLDVPHREVTAVLARMAAQAGVERGRFVVFEGGEGSGKTTQVRSLAAYLRAWGSEVVTTREPGGTIVGRSIRNLLLDSGTVAVDDPLSDRAEALLFAADRAHHVATVVRPALTRGAVVVSDRYVDSTLAYQGAGRAIDAEQMRWLTGFATDGLVPDLTVLLDVPVADGLDRASRRGPGNRMEAEDVSFHRRVRRQLLALAAAEPDRYVVVDALLPEPVVAERVAVAVERVVASAPRQGAAVAERWTMT